MSGAEFVGRLRLSREILTDWSAHDERVEDLSGSHAMGNRIEIDTLNGVISSTSNALAEAMAELIAAEYRADEDDLMEAVCFDLDLGDVGGEASPTVSAA